jgi:cytochrome c oxidase assembly protein subunit 15
MKTSTYDPAVHWLAATTVCLALLPIVMGALVTTRGAGMAFPDWPSSDGQNMLSYPWWQAAGDKFLEHGHRLAGVLIGLAAIALVAVTCFRESRTWVKLLAGGVLLGVIAQGILGGQRVVLDARGLAFVHGSFAAVVFSLMASLMLVTSRTWIAAEPPATADRLQSVAVLGVCTAVGVMVQYVLGGLLRHLGMMMHQHLGFAFLVLILVLAFGHQAWHSGQKWLRWPALTLVGLTIGQIALGLTTWVAKYGFGEYVAVANSPFQVSMRTAHFIVGMLILMTTVILTLRACRLQWLRSPVPVSGSLFDPSVNLPEGAR